MATTVSISETYAILGQFITTAREAQRDLNRAANAETEIERNTILARLGASLSMVIVPDQNTVTPEEGETPNA